MTIIGGGRRILLLVPSMAGAGGTERVVHSLSGLLASAAHEVHQASFDAPDVPRHFVGASAFHALGPIPRLPLPLRPLAYVIAAVKLRRLKKRLGVEVTISNLWSADLISALSGGADRKYALCHINVVGNPANRLMIKFLPLVRIIYGRFHQVIAVSEGLKHELAALYRLPPGRVTHIHNFVDRPAAQSALPDDGLTRFVWCGRFSSEKNVEGLLYAWSAFTSRTTGTQLVLVGDGQLRVDLERLATTLGLRWSTDVSDRGAMVVFAGKVQEPAAFMLGARALLLSSRAEGLPMVILEALALGVPILASDCPAGGNRTAILGSGSCNPDRTSAEEGPAGLLLPVPDPAMPARLEIWVQALLSACEDEQHRKWVSGTRERTQVFSSDAARERWLATLLLTGTTA